MGNAQTPDGADHDLYRRPADGTEPQYSVQQPSKPIIDDGAGAVGGPGTGGSTREATAPRQGEPAGSPPAALPIRQRINLALTGAWVLVGLLLASGLTWLTGVLPPALMTYDASGNVVDPSPSVLVVNLQSLGPIPFLFGVMGAFTLLAVQAAQFRRTAGRSA